MPNVAKASEAAESCRKKYPKRFNRKQAPTAPVSDWMLTNNTGSSWCSFFHSVAVLHPMPTGVKPLKMKTLGIRVLYMIEYFLLQQVNYSLSRLGAPKPGPRFREDGTFVAHSVLGTVDNYSNSLFADNKVRY